MDDYVKTLVDEFRDERSLCGDFCLAIFQLLNGLLQDGGYKYQAFHRIKDIEKLEEKLIRKRNEGKVYNSLKEIEDLAGIRIVFYLESDKYQFIRDIFDEISGDLKLEENKKETGYEATHIVASLGPKRLQLSEYRKFDRLKCEIQLTSILHHAWAEIEHDIFYKEELEIKRLHPKKLKHLRKRMASIMKKHINKASSQFEDIMAQIRKIKKAP